MKTPTHDDATGQRAYAIMQERLAAHHAAIARGEPSAAPAWHDCLEAARAEAPAAATEPKPARAKRERAE